MKRIPHSFCLTRLLSGEKKQTVRNQTYPPPKPRQGRSTPGCVSAEMEGPQLPSLALDGGLAACGQCRVGFTEGLPSRRRAMRARLVPTPLAPAQTTVNAQEPPRVPRPFPQHRLVGEGSPSPMERY